jgi:hypothetical protein
MTEAAAFLELLRLGGWTVTAAGDRLFVEPRATLTPVDCETIRRLKPGLLALVGGELEPCNVCRGMCNPAAKDDIQRLCEYRHCPAKPFQQERSYTPVRKRSIG